jgi:hypothetical protein
MFIECSLDVFVSQCISAQYSGAYASLDIDNSLDFERFKKDFQANIVSLTDEVIFNYVLTCVNLAFFLGD